MQYNTKYALAQHVWFLIDGGDATNLFLGVCKGKIVNIFFGTEYEQYKKPANKIFYKIKTNKIYGFMDYQVVTENLVFETIQELTRYINNQAEKKQIAREKYIATMRVYKKKVKS